MNTPEEAPGGHVPVLRDRVLDLLAPAVERQHGAAASSAPATYVDGTLGMGGHALAVLERFPHVRVIGIDRDAAALEAATTRLSAFSDRFVPVHAVYDDIAEVLHGLGIERVEAMLFDLGVSSMQLDQEERGFAYRVDAPLDMRMDQSQGITAAEILNTYSQPALTQILREFGEEKFARQIARAIVKERDDAPFTDSARLVALLHRVIPAASQRTGGHPAKRTFQAVRIEVNAELSVWRRALPQALSFLPEGGRAVVLSYHSLEDRITKRTLVEAASSAAPPDMPVEPKQDQAWLRLLSRGAEKASAAEVEANPRAASVRLRAAEVISEYAQAHRNPQASRRPQQAPSAQERDT